MKNNINFTLAVLLLSLMSCDNFLEEKPDQRLVVPGTLDDLQAMLDNTALQNDPYSGEICAGDYYLTDADWQAMTSEQHKRAYIWENTYTTVTNDWYTPYRNIYWANIVLENVEKIERDAASQARWDDLKGQALFLRARGLLSVAAIWAPVYDESNAQQKPGIPLRLTSDFNTPSTPASVEETYNQIIQDLTQAAALLPEKPVHVIRASRQAALALLARSYLLMGKYSECLEACNQSLDIDRMLIDLNTLDSARAYPVGQFSPEVIYFSQLPNPVPLSINRAKMDTALYHSYAKDDLRRSLFYRDNKNGSYSFRGSYSASSTPFSGLAIDEVYLMRSECQARTGDVNGAMATLNELLVTRWRKGKFVAYASGNHEEALKLILEERRKELLMRGLRIADLKRLNRDGFNISVSRTVGNMTYTLAPNDLRYNVLIPEEVIANSGLIQNER